MNGTTAQISSADRELGALETRVSVFNRGDDCEPEPRKELPAQENGLANYFKQSLRSKIVQYGAVGIFAFGVGASYSGNFGKSCKAVGDVVKNGVGYYVGAMFNALPKEQRYSILRENAKSMTPKELADQIKKLEK